MSNPKMSQLIAKALELGITDEAAARALIKKHKVLTFGKLERAVKSTGGTRGPMQERIDQDTAKQIVRSTKLQLRKSKDSTIHMAGPRGFRLGPTWLKSIAEGRGVALRPANFPKLLATAEAKGVSLPRTAKLSQKDVAALVAKAIH